MKIDGNNEIVRNAVVSETDSKDAKSDKEFKDILKASVERTAEQPAKIPTPTQPGPVTSIRFAPLSPEAREMTVERVDNLLNLLDQYRDQLANPKVTLRTIEPILNTIAKEKEQLTGVLENIANDDGLKDIVHRTLITASVEVMKFNRGDYVTA